MRRTAGLATALLVLAITASCFGTSTISTAPEASSAASSVAASKTGRMRGTLATIGGPACVLSLCSRPTPHTACRVLSDGRLIRTVRTDGRGRFSITLPVGRYTLRVGTRTPIHPKAVRITAGHTTRLVVSVQAK
jgi:hypothetical protein